MQYTCMYVGQGVASAYMIAVDWPHELANLSMIGSQRTELLLYYRLANYSKHSQSPPQRRINHNSIKYDCCLSEILRPTVLLQVRNVAITSIQMALSHCVSECQSDESALFAIFSQNWLPWQVATSLEILAKQVHIECLHPKRFRSVKRLRKSDPEIIADHTRRHQDTHGSVRVGDFHAAGTTSCKLHRWM